MYQTSFVNEKSPPIQSVLDLTDFNKKITNFSEQLNQMKKEHPEKWKEKSYQKQSSNSKGRYQEEKKQLKKSLQKVRNHSSHSFIQNSQNTSVNQGQKYTFSAKNAQGFNNPRQNLNSNIFKSIK